MSKAVRAALGFAMCHLTVSGMRLWLARREAASLAPLRWGLGVVTFGLPLALLASAIGFFAARGSGAASFWTPAVFLIASGLVIAYGLWRRGPDLLDRRLRMAAAACLVVVALRLLTGGPSWPTAVEAGQPIIAALDLLLLCAGAALWPRRRQLTSPAVEQSVPAG